MMGALKKLDLLVSKVLKAIGLFCFAGLFAILIVNVFVRWVPIFSNNPYFSMGWFDEIVEMLFAWMIMTTASILCRDKAHFKVDLLQTTWPNKPWVKWVNVCCDIISLAFLVALFYYSIQLTGKATQLTQEMHIQKKWFYLCMPVNSFLMGCYTIRDAVQDLKACFQKASIA